MDFCKKAKVDGSGVRTTKYEARLVTCGFQQPHGVDYGETFAAVVKVSTLRLLLSLDAAENLAFCKMDVKTAFLKGKLQQDISVEEPESFADEERPGFVCKLLKALYCLKQALRRPFVITKAFL